MDELKQLWDNIAVEGDHTSIQLAPDNRAIHSPGILSEIRNKVKWKFRYAVLFTAAFAMALPWISPLASQLLVSVMTVAYLIGAILLYQELQLLKTDLDHTQNISAYMLQFHARIKRVIRYEELAVLFLLPVSISAGLLFGMKLNSPDQDIMTLPVQWAIFIGSLIVYTLLGYFITRKLNQKSFGPFVKELERNIEELKAG